MSTETVQSEPVLPDVFTPEAQAVPPVRQPSIFDRAVCLSVEIGRIGTRRTVNANQVETDADRKMLHVSKDIIDSPELKAVAKADGDLRRYLKKRCLPSQFRMGIYLLPIALIEEVDAEVEARKAKRQTLVDAFLATYEYRKEEARARLGSLFSEVDYPPIERVRAAFYLNTKYVEFATPASLRQIKAELFAREREKAAAQWTNALEECRGVLREAFADLVGHMAERLQPGDDGKPKQFRESMVKNLTEFLRTFEARNIGDDQELASLVRRARDVMEGVTSKDLRSNEALRDAVARSMTEMKATLDTMLVDRPNRKISFDLE